MDVTIPPTADNLMTIWRGIFFLSYSSIVAHGGQTSCACSANELSFLETVLFRLTWVLYRSFWGRSWGGLWTQQSSPWLTGSPPFPRRPFPFPWQSSCGQSPCCHLASHRWTYLTLKHKVTKKKEHNSSYSVLISHNRLLRKGDCDDPRVDFRGKWSNILSSHRMLFPTVGKPVATTNTVVAALQFKYNNNRTHLAPIKPLNSLNRSRKNKSFYPL